MTRVRRRHVGHVGPAHVQQAAQRHVQHSVDGRARVRLLAAARPRFKKWMEGHPGARPSEKIQIMEKEHLAIVQVALRDVFLFFDEHAN